MKQSGVEWIGEIPEDWEVKRGKELFFEINDRCKNPENYPLLSVSEYYGVAPKSEKIEEGDFITHAETLDGYKICQKGDIVQNIMLAWKRATGMSNYEGLISPAYCIYRPYKGIDSKYYHYLFRTDVYADLFKQYSTGIIDSRLRLYPAKFLSLKYAYPPKENQQHIASYLDKKCSKIEETIQNQQQVIEKLKAYKQFLITEAVTGKVKIENGKACGEYESYKDSGVEWIGKIPSGWEVKKAKYFIKISNGSDPKTEEGDTPVYGSGAESFKTCVEFKEGPTVLIGRKGATLHIPHYIEGNYWNVDTAFDVKTYSEEILLLKFYYYCATAFDYRFYLTSTTLPSMTQTNYGNMYLPVPNTLVQKEIVEFLDNKYDAIDTVIEQKQNLIEKLTEYKKSLIYECVTGKKEI